MSTKNDQASLIIDGDKTEHKKLQEPQVLNEETLRALQEVVERKDLIHAEDADDLFDKLGL